MIAKNSLLQMFRTPIKTILFLILIIIACAFCTIGGNLWLLSDRNIKAYEEGFTTIGTVEQRFLDVKETKRWDAELNDYILYNEKQYSNLIGIDKLQVNFDNYIENPEFRPFYGAYSPGYKLDNELQGLFIAEVTPIEDVQRTKPVKIQINKVLYGDTSIEGSTVYFCNHYDPDPEKLVMGKKYIMSLQEAMPHQNMIDNGTEFRPAYINSTQCTKEGVPYESNIPEKLFCDEIEDGYYKTNKGQIWVELVKSLEMDANTMPVVGTNSTNLLMPFYNNEAYICEGQNITKQEYKDGSRVCLVSSDFARNNNLNIGDAVNLKLFYANYKDAVGKVFILGGGQVRNYTLLDANGKVYSVFEDSDYVIKGIYNNYKSVATNEYSLGKNEVIIPFCSIKNDDSKNVVAYGPMQSYNTSFQIENGEIANYLKKFNQMNISQLEINFYDGGYSKLKYGIENIKKMSMILAVLGVLMMLCILMFYGYIFISKQKQRIAIEKSLGFTNGQCILSIMTGILVVLILGSILGGILGVAQTKSIYKVYLNQTYYDTEYGNSYTNNTETDLLTVGSITNIIGISVLILIVILIAGGAVLFIQVYFIVNKKLILLLEE